MPRYGGRMSQVRWPPPNSEDKATPRPPVAGGPMEPAEGPRAYGFEERQDAPERFDKSRLLTAAVAGSLAAGTDIGGLSRPDLGFAVQSLIVTNLTGYTLWFPEVLGFVPPNQTGYIVACRPATHSLRCQVLTSSPTGGSIYVVADERPRDPTTADIDTTGGGGSNTNDTIVAPLGAGAAGTGVRVEGDGTAGTPVGGVLSVQGTVGGQSIPISGNVGITGTVAVTQSGAWTVAATQSGAWTAAATQSGTWTVQPGNTPNTTPWLVQQVPGVGGGCSTIRLSAATAATGAVKAAAGSFKGLQLLNTTAAIRYVHIYNKATAPTLGTDTPVYTIGLPASAGANVDLVDGVPAGTGLAYAVTTDDAATPATGATAGDVQGTLLYV